jgi:hypothetical protein
VGWVVLGLAALIIGISKTGFPGIGIVPIAMAAMVIPAKQSTGIILPMLIVGDLFAVSYYRRNVVWSHLLKLLPCAIVGVVVGFLLLRVTASQQLRPIIGGTILVMLGLNLWRDYAMRSTARAGVSSMGVPPMQPDGVSPADARVAAVPAARRAGVSPARQDALPEGSKGTSFFSLPRKAAEAFHGPGPHEHAGLLTAGEKKDVPFGLWFPIVMGVLAGTTTMMANAAGPIMIIYLLAMRLPKKEFVGTGAWYFLLVNLLKVPFSASPDLGLINAHSLQFNLILSPLIVIGALAGVRLVKYVPQKTFTKWMQILAALGALQLLLGIGGTPEHHVAK